MDRPMCVSLCNILLLLGKANLKKSLSFTVSFKGLNRQISFLHFVWSTFYFPVMDCSGLLYFVLMEDSVSQLWSTFCCWFWKELVSSVVSGSVSTGYCKSWQETHFHKSCLSDQNSDYTDCLSHKIPFGFVLWEKQRICVFIFESNTGRGTFMKFPGET